MKKCTWIFCQRMKLFKLPILYGIAFRASTKKPYWNAIVVIATAETLFVLTLFDALKIILCITSVSFSSEISTRIFSGWNLHFLQFSTNSSSARELLNKIISVRSHNSTDWKSALTMYNVALLIMQQSINEDIGYTYTRWRCYTNKYFIFNCDYLEYS